MVVDQIDDPEIKIFIYDTIVIEDFEEKNNMTKEVLNYLIDQNNELLLSTGLDFNTDQAILASKLMIFLKLNYQEENDWLVEIHFSMRTTATRKFLLNDCKITIKKLG